MGFLSGHMFSPWFFESTASVYIFCNKESYSKDLKKEKIKLWQNGLVFCIVLKMGSDVGLIFWNLWISRNASKLSRNESCSTGLRYLQLYLLLGDRIDTEAKKMASRGLFLIIKNEGSPKAEKWQIFLQHVSKPMIIQWSKNRTILS